MSGPPLLEVRGLRARYAAAEVLHGVDLVVEPGEMVFALGPNGAGKSTLLRCLAGRVPGKGEVTLGGRALLPLSTRERIARGVVLCPEGRRLFADMTVRENLLLGAHLRRDVGAVRRDFDRLVEHLPWLPARLGQAAGTLSGGEQQMVAVARALMAAPRLLLLDEPTVGLSPAAIAQLEAWLRLQSSDYGVTILGTEQNVAFARGLATRLAVLAGGRIVAAGRPEVIAGGGIAELTASWFGPGADGEEVSGTP